MNMRYFAKALALTAGSLLAASSALGAVVDGITVVEPITAPNTETIGPRSTIIVDVDGGLAGANIITDGQPVSRAALIPLNDMGNAIPGVFLDCSAGVIAQNYNDGGAPGVDDLTINLANVTNVESFLNTTGAASFRLIVTTTDIMLNINNINGVQTIWSANEAVDQCFDSDTVRPVLSGAIVNTMGDAIFFVFTESLNTGNATNDPNQTVVANVLANTNFQVGPMFNSGPTGLTNPTFPPGSTSIIRYDRDSMNTNVSAGTVIRPAFDTMTQLPINIIRDEVANQATIASTSVTNQVALAASSATFVEDVPVGGGTVVDAVRVTFNNPITTVGDNDTYVLRRPNAAGSSEEDSDIVLFNPHIDPNDPFSVLLDAQQSFDEGVGANGRSISNDNNVPDNAAYEVRVTDAGAVDPADVFGGTFSGTTDLAAADGIEPGLVFTAFGDADGDGNQDTAYLVFDESMANVTANTGFTVVRNGGVTVRPFFLIGADGSLTEEMTVSNMTPANNNLPNIVVSRTSIDVDNDGTISDREMNNAVCAAYDPLTFDWNNNGLVGPANDPMEAVPGTGDPNVVNMQYVVSTGSVQDAAGNLFENGGSDVNNAASTDRARPRVAVVLFFTGDNQGYDAFWDPLPSNDQYFSEQDEELGDQEDNNRIAIYFGEFLSIGALNESQVFFGPGLSSSFDNNAFLFSTDNCITLINTDGDPDLEVGQPVSIAASSGIEDAAGNEALSGDDIGDCRAPYSALQSGVDGGVFAGGFLQDSDNDGFADAIAIAMTQPILASTLANGDFSLSIGTVTGVALDSSLPNVIIISITDGVVSMNNTVTVTYNGSSDTNRIASDEDEGGTGKAISAVNDSIDVSAVQESTQPTQAVAIQDVIGTGLLPDGVTPFPTGTKVYAFIAVPTARKITATHNNVGFAVDADWDTSSLEAWTNWLLGLEEYIYLARDLDNFQFYSNYKDEGDSNSGISTYKDVIQLQVNSRSLTAITFTGRGESNTDIVSNGRVDLCWDVLRSSGGSMANLFRRFWGYNWGGTPISSRAVVTGNDGRFEIHISAPISAFNARPNLNSVGYPIILVVETPAGLRYAVSSVVSSINGGPLLFNPQNRRQNQDRSAVDATVFNINLANVGTEQLHPGWNLVGFNRAGGFATATNSRPTLPAGVTTSNVVVGTTLPFAGPLDQFVYFRDPNRDGEWTVSEDSDFSDIVIDFDCLANWFAFTMTSFGVQAGTGINNVVGGYAIGIFNNSVNAWSYGMFQFGAPRSGTALFSASAPFSNSSANLGWGLFTSPTAFDPATGIGGTANPNLDYIILFRNNGPLASQTFEVSSLDLAAPTGTDNINDTEEVDAGQAFFGHFR